MKDLYLSLPSGGGQITDIESVGDGFIRFKNGHQICWGLVHWSEMTRPSAGGSGSGSGGRSGGDLDGGIMHDGDAENASFVDYKESDSMRKTIKFPAPFTITPYIVISSASSSNISSQTSIPATWYHDESATDFTAELYSAVKLTWIAIGKWK